jgi:hypothetical protein
MLGVGLIGWCLLGVLSVSPARSESLRRTGRVVVGWERAVIVQPLAARVVAYQNAGYRLELDGGATVVRVDLDPIDSVALFSPRPRGRNGDGQHRGDRVERLALGITANATTVYDASSLILDWVARNIRYELDRTASQELEAVLDRRSAYCTGIARLTVGLLMASGIEAREVPGWVAAANDRGGPQGYHRWVEIHFPDRGWVFSDPLWSHHFVPSTYVRLESESLLLSGSFDAEDGAEVVERSSRLEIIDISPHGGAEVLVRPNRLEQRLAALRVVLEPSRAGWAILDGAGLRRRARLRDGTVTFVGLPSANYVLTVQEQLVGGAIREAARQEITLSKTTRREVRLVGAPVGSGPWVGQAMGEAAGSAETVR